MKNFSKNLLFAIVGLLLVTLAFSYFAGSPAPAPQTLSVSDVAQKVNAGDVKTITVNGNDLALTLTDGSQAVSQKEEETGVVETLKNYGEIGRAHV